MVGTMPRLVFQTGHRFLFIPELCAALDSRADHQCVGVLSRPDVECGTRIPARFRAVRQGDQIARTPTRHVHTWSR